VPRYPGTGQATLLYENQQNFFCYQERLTATMKTQAFQLRRVTRQAIPFGASVEVSFSGAPGTLQIDVQTADSDEDGKYTVLTSIAAVNSSNVGRVELPSFWAKYIRLSVTTLTNDVLMTGMVSR